MSILPEIYPKDLVKALLQQGFVIMRQKGSHVRLIHQDGRSATISLHNKPLPIGTLSAILRQVHIRKKELIELL
jgi:predicted RNA binding protein YcfA (HicA-like mRNA interferase family)